MAEKDKARKETDRKLRMTEKKVGRVYRENPALLSALKEYKAFMAEVQEKTRKEYEAWKNATPEDDKAALKKEYEEAVRDLTLRSKRYAKLIDRVTDAIATANQQAVEIANDARYEVYVANYNQAAEELRKAGIKIK